MIEVFLSVYGLFLVPNDLELVCRFVLGDYKSGKTWTFSTRDDSSHMSGQTHNPFDELPTYLHSCDILVKRFLYIWRDSLRLSALTPNLLPRIQDGQHKTQKVMMMQREAA
jgi:hypothetical protein